MVIRRDTGETAHSRFSEIGSFLSPNDALVVNRTKVIPARLSARKSTGGSVELLLLRRHEEDRWSALARPSKRLRVGTSLHIGDTELQAIVVESRGSGEWMIRFGDSDAVAECLQRAGTVPLPPYIHAPDAPVDRYQTVYADRDGSVAAPTAGLHFSRELLESIRGKGISIEQVTLHVGLGTFRPVAVDVVEEHRVPPEWGEINGSTAARLNERRANGGRVVAVGTTTTRLLESSADDFGNARAFSGDTDRFIYPGYRFRIVDSLITNFHLPRSSLLMLVSAFAGHDVMMSAYREAVRLRYRFYSFGDAMLIR